MRLNFEHLEEEKSGQFNNFPNSGLGITQQQQSFAAVGGPVRIDSGIGGAPLSIGSGIPSGNPILTRQGSGGIAGSGIQNSGSFSGFGMGI